MPNGVIYKNIFPDVASLAANTQDPNYPAVNLKNDAPAKRFNSLDAYIVIDAAYAAPVTCQAFAIVNHNFPVNSPALAVRCSNSPTFQTYTAYDFTYNPETVVCVVETPAAYQYYRFIFNLGNGDYVGSIGQIIMGDFLPFPNRIVNPVQVTPVHNQAQIRPETAQKSRQTISIVYQFTLSFQSVKYSDYKSILNALLYNDRAKVLVLNHESGLLALQGHETEIPAASGQNGYYDFTLKFETNPNEVH